MINKIIDWLFAIFIVVFLVIVFTFVMLSINKFDDHFDNQARIIFQNDQIIELLQPDIALDLTQDFGSPMIYEYKTIKPKVKK